MAQIPDLDPIVSLDGPELLVTRDDFEDVKVTVDQIADFAIDKLTPAETLTKVIAANPQVNGLNAALLQGFAASYFTNASNLSSGTIPEGRLPLGEFDYTWLSGGLVPSEGSLRCKWKIPFFLADGTPGSTGIMFQFGWTNFVGDNQTVTVTFLESFSSFLGTTNKPLVYVTPECKMNEGSQPRDRVELDMRLDYNSKTLSGFRCHSRRTAGSGGDQVRGNWLAVGFYG